jgi:type VI protein secretion system component Hcp
MAHELFMKVEGIDGLATHDVWKSEKWHEIQSFQFGVNNGVGGDRTFESAGTASTSDIAVSMTQDKNTPAFVQKCVQGLHIPNIEIGHAGGTERNQKHLMWKFEDNLITNVSLHAGPEGKPSVNITFAFAKFSMDSSKVDSRNAKVEAGAKFGYDFKTMKA